MPMSTIRTVIDMKQGSYLITLPKQWVRYMRIQPGDKLEVTIRDHLTVRTIRRDRHCAITKPE